MGIFASIAGMLFSCCCCFCCWFSYSVVKSESESDTSDRQIAENIQRIQEISRLRRSQRTSTVEQQIEYPPVADAYPTSHPAPQTVPAQPSIRAESAAATSYPPQQQPAPYPTGGQAPSAPYASNRNPYTSNEDPYPSAPPFAIEDPPPAYDDLPWIPQ